MTGLSDPRDVPVAHRRPAGARGRVVAAADPEDRS